MINHKAIGHMNSFFYGVKLTDVIDILIIAVFIYIILVWLKQARARFIFIGMIIVGSVYAVANLFGLFLTTVALQAFFAVAVIMLAVIFQDDLRHFFESIGVFGAARRRGKGSFARNIDILCSASANLSRKKNGALIVIRGIDPLERHLEAGVSLDGLMSEVLLESVFDRYAPGHDGALIIEGERIARFGCYLPLSVNIKEMGRLGTRHAAGVGITERTDAFSIVISEEQGTISVAEKGRIRHLPDAEHLSRALHEFYNRKFPENKKTGLMRFLTKHLLKKILALVLAFSLWLLFGYHAETVRRDYVVPIEYRNLEIKRVIREPKMKEVTVTLSGSEQAFSLLKPAELKISVDTSTIKDGENKLALTKELIRFPSSLSLISIEPNEIVLNSHKTISLDIPVELKTKGSPPSGIVIREIKVEPKSVSALIPSTFHQEKLAITMEPIDLKTIRETATVSPKLIVAPEIGFPDNKPPDVKVIIEVQKQEKAE